MSVGIYPTNSAEATRYVIEHSGADIVVVEGQKELDKIMPYRDQLSGVKAIVQYWGKPTMEGVMSWEELIKIGRESGKQEELEERLSRVAINQCCHLVYTSGTTGHPKVLLAIKIMLNFNFHIL